MLRHLTSQQQYCGRSKQWQHHTAVVQCSNLILSRQQAFRPQTTHTTKCRKSVVVLAQPDGSADAEGNSSGGAQEPCQQQQQQTLQPTLNDGVNWYCYTALGLLFLTDFTPLGQWLLSGLPGSAAASRLALLQWAAFVLPTLYWMRNKGWDVRAVLRLQQLGTPQQWLAGVAAGPVLWALINAAIAIKTGNADTWLAAAADAASSSSSSSPGMLLLSGGSSEAGVGWAQLPQLLLAAAVSPAVAEELLFRGFLLTALQERLGRIDAVAVCAALFALIHLEPQQFFLYCVLGGAAGAAAVRSGSLGPAVALHFGFNAAAVVAGLVLHVR